MKMCYIQLIYVCFFLSVTIRSGLFTMVHSPNENEWVEEGRNISLVCATDHPWQWCYWEKDISNNKTIYQTVQEYNSLYTSDPTIKFVHLTENSCGIQIVGASAKSHQVCPVSDLMQQQLYIYFHILNKPFYFILFDFLGKMEMSSSQNRSNQWSSQRY